MSVGENIQRIRTERGISQRELAKKVGITQAMICQIEREIRNPSLQVAAIIAATLNCNLEDLLQKGGDK